jgi:hypothetical protein
MIRLYSASSTPEGEATFCDSNHIGSEPKMSQTRTEDPRTYEMEITMKRLLVLATLVSLYAMAGSPLIAQEAPAATERP